MKSILFAVITALWSLTALATADGPDHYRVQNLAAGEVLRINAEPQVDAQRVGSIPADAQCLRNLGCRGGLSLDEFSTLSEEEKQRRLTANPRWCKVDYQGLTGWVEGRYLAEGWCPQAATTMEQRTEHVTFAKESGATTFKSRIKGREYVDYVITAKAGQTLAVSLAASNRQNYFNVNPPANEWSMFVGSSSGNRFTRMVPVDGDYIVRVYLMRAAARRNEASNYTLRVVLSGKGLVPISSSKDALIAGTPFHASATISCTQASDPARKTCDAFVIRRSFDGTATVEIRWRANAVERVRRVLFMKGKAMSSDSPDAISFSRQGDLNLIRIGNDEHYSIPDALIVGG